MPKRTNAFQKLVLRITQHFSSKTAVVSESKMLWDEEAKAPREIDILIEEKVGAHSILIGIECTAKSSPVGLKEIEQLHAKHKNLGISKTVIVSLHGFTKTAQRVAKARNIDALPLSRALNCDWPKYMEPFRKFEIGHLAARASEVEFEVTPEAGANGFDASYPVYVKTEHGHIPMADYAIGLFEGRLSEYYFEAQKAGAEPAGHGRKELLHEVFCFTPPLTLLDKNGVHTETAYLNVTCEFFSSMVGIETQYAPYGKEELVYGAAKNVGMFASATLTVSPSGEVDEQGNKKVRMSINLDTGDI